jgi:hypothetical protein
MAQSPAGKWVSYEDYARLKADLRNCHTAIRVKEEENARLKAEVERLKEGNECLDQMHEKEMARSAFLCEEVNRTTAWGRGLESDLSWARAELLMVKAEVERLRASSFVTAVPVEQYERVIKAGDAMYYWLGVCGRRNNSTGDDWLRAKKGAMLQSEQFELERKNLRWVVFNAKEGKPSV